MGVGVNVAVGWGVKVNVGTEGSVGSRVTMEGLDGDSGLQAAQV